MIPALTVILLRVAAFAVVAGFLSNFGQYANG